MCITLASTHSIPDPESRVREYVRIEVYRGYDDQHAVTDRIGWGEMRAANRLFARLGREPAARLIASAAVGAALMKVQDEELDTFGDASWLTMRDALVTLLARAIDLHGIGLAVATKILHLKRPHLIPVLDSFVVKLLSHVELGSIDNNDRLVKTGIRTIETIRSDLRHQLREFANLESALTDLPIPLTRVRLYDILCWSTEKWDVRGDTGAPFGTASTSTMPCGGR